MSPLAVLLLRDGVIVEASPLLLDLLGVARKDLTGSSVESVVTGGWDPEAVVPVVVGAVAVLQVRRGTWRRADGRTFAAECWLSPTGAAGERECVAVLRPVDHDLTPSVRALDLEDAPSLLAVGTVDAAWSVDRVSADIEALLGYPPADVVGATVRTSVHPADLPALLIAVGHAWQLGEAAAAVVLRLLRADETWVVVRAVVSPAIGQKAPAFGFAVTPVVESPAAQRRRDEERRLLLLGREVELAQLAAGLGRMPTAVQLPALSQLSARELEITGRLLAGDRVPLIARSLFLSASTVRNHLTAVYRKLGVESQQGLLDLLRL